MSTNGNPSSNAAWVEQSRAEQMMVERAVSALPEHTRLELAYLLANRLEERSALERWARTC